MASSDSTAGFGPLDGSTGLSARQQVGRTARRRDHGHLVPEPAQLVADASDVLVDLVRLRPGERRDEADAEAHRVRV